MVPNDTMNNPCATPQSGAWSPLTIAHPTQPSSICSSARSTTKQSLQPVQYDDIANDSGRGQRGAFWAVRDEP